MENTIQIRRGLFDQPLEPPEENIYCEQCEKRIENGDEKTINNDILCEKCFEELEQEEEKTIQKSEEKQIHENNNLTIRELAYVLRGGSRHSSPANLRSACHGGNRSDAIGFRLFLYFR